MANCDVKMASTSTDEAVATTTTTNTTNTTTTTTSGEKEWNPTLSSFADNEVYTRWLSRFRDFGGKLRKQKPPRIFVVQEGNQSGPFWRLLWPKSAEKPDEQWWQAMRIEAHADNDATLTMQTLENGAQVTIEGVEGRVERSAATSGKFCFWFVPNYLDRQQ